MAAVGVMGTPLPSPKAGLEVASTPAAPKSEASCFGIPISPVVLGLVIANIAASTALVGVNKYLVVSYGFK
jgi:hypothetical protein